ncbi:MAG TPA: metallopeptidase TldD-related protein [Bacteroidales bacterium]|nr:metallopeptidase TldD-related protein [Bacteroidales bacterium]
MKKLSFFILLLFSLTQTANSQSYNDMPKDSIVIKALRDELYRNLNRLESKDAGKPFFISYSYLQGKVVQASALLGSLISSDEYPVTDWTLRLMMGNYNINDENFEDRYTQQDEKQEYQVKPPLEPDYWGLRRMFWWNTSNVFRSAAQNYKSKLAALKDKPIRSEEEKMPDYTQATPIKRFEKSINEEVSKQEAEAFVRNLSLVFKGYKDVHRSNASLYIYNATVYIMNTEGTELMIPINFVYANISASVYTEKGDDLSESITFFGNKFSDLPSADSIKSAANMLANYLNELKKAETIKENYSGPVLLYDDAAANLLASGLFGGNMPLIAYRKPLVNDISKEMTPKDNNSIESRMDKKIIAKDLSVKALPQLKTYNGVNLFGSFDIDNEGIVPAKEVNLVEKGILKGLLSGRVPSKKSPGSNGHNRLGIAGGGFYTTIGPGIIEVTSDNTKNEADLKKQAAELAQDNGLEYVFIIRPLFRGNNCYSPLNYYQYDINTGKEKLVRPMSIDNISLNTLNKIDGAGKSMFVKNAVFQGENFSNDFSGRGLFTSFIVPSSLLIREIELQAPADYGNTDLPILENPVSELNK